MSRIRSFLLTLAVAGVATACRGAADNPKAGKVDGTGQTGNVRSAYSETPAPPPTPQAAPVGGDTTGTRPVQGTTGTTTPGNGGAYGAGTTSTTNNSMPTRSMDASGSADATGSAGSAGSAAGSNAQRPTPASTAGTARDDASRTQAGSGSAMAPSRTP